MWFVRSSPPGAEVNPMDLCISIAVIAFLIQLRALFVLRPARLVGDENEYARDPASPPQALWVRTPLFGVWVRVCTWAAGGRALGPRVANSALSAATVGLVAHEIQRAAGPIPALIGGALIIASLERAVLSVHLWPDIAMGLLWLICLSIIGTPDPLQPLWLSLVGGVALGIRVEGAALWLLCLLAVLTLPGASFGWILAATALSLTIPWVYILWNGRTLGIWRLDTTTRFNTQVALEDATSRATTVSAVMRQTAQQLRGGIADRVPAQSPSLKALLPRVAARWRLLLGPETFVSQVLCANDMVLYHPGHTLLRTPVGQINLRHGFSAIFAAALVVLPLAQPLSIAVLALMILIYGGVVSRSRYRMAILPLITVQAVTGWHRVWDQGIGSGLVWGLALGAVFAALLVFAPRLDET